MPQINSIIKQNTITLLLCTLNTAKTYFYKDLLLLFIILQYLIIAFDMFNWILFSVASLSILVILDYN